MIKQRGITVIELSVIIAYLAIVVSAAVNGGRTHRCQHGRVSPMAPLAAERHCTATR